jgi:hypothetical protein
VAIVFTVEDSVDLDIIPDGFPARELVKGEQVFTDSDSDGIEDQVDRPDYAGCALQGRI